MQVDSFFSIGTSHNICEDYALHGVVSEQPFAVLSDGCSSSQYTDFGSRFMCLAVRETIKVSPPERGLTLDAVLPYACSLVGTISPRECLDATVAVLDSSKELLATYMVGDGVTVARRRNGLFLVRQIEFSNNAPGYLTYRLDGGRYSAFKEGIAGEAGGIRTVTETWWDSDFEKQIGDSRVYTDEVTEDPTTFWCQIVYDRGTFDLVAAFSDGVQSFRRIDEYGLVHPRPLNEVLYQLMSFKNLKGEFVKRRCRMFFKKFCIQNSWSHYDDFSMVSLYDDDTFVEGK